MDSLKLLFWLYVAIALFFIGFATLFGRESMKQTAHFFFRRPVFWAARKMKVAAIAVLRWAFDKTRNLVKRALEAIGRLIWKIMRRLLQATKNKIGAALTWLLKKSWNLISKIPIAVRVVGRGIRNLFLRARTNYPGSWLERRLPRLLLFA